MNAYSRFGAVRARYQNVDLASRVESASPHGLVAILLDELMKSLEAMAAACNRRDYSQRGTAQARALNMLNGLESSLDFDKGGEIAQSLASIYREARRLTLAGARDNDAEQVLRARTMVGEIASAWQAIG
jgi:flagellar secretion chaperone FliS